MRVREKNNGLLGNVTSRRSHPRRDASRDFMGMKKRRQEERERRVEKEVEKEKRRRAKKKRKRTVLDDGVHGGVKTVRVENTWVHKMPRIIPLDV